MQHMKEDIKTINLLSCFYFGSLDEFRIIASSDSGSIKTMNSKNINKVFLHFLFFVIKLSNYDHN